MKEVKEGYDAQILFANQQVHMYRSNYEVILAENGGLKKRIQQLEEESKRLVEENERLGFEIALEKDLFRMNNGEEGKESV